jgi:hypothetical protein
MKECRVMLGHRPDRRRRQQKVDAGRTGTIRGKSKHKTRQLQGISPWKSKMPSKFDLALQSMHPFTVPDLAFQWAPLEWHERQKMAEEWSQCAL